MKILFWNVDTQRDFMNPDGKLYIKGAEEIKPTLKLLTDLAEKYNIKVVNTRDCHFKDSKELSNNPDFKTTFPPHCMRNTHGTKFIKETRPKSCFNIDYVNINDEWFTYSFNNILNTRNISIFKDDFDVFKGNPYTKQILSLINPDLIVVYGVATNVCVNFAVVGLRKLGYIVVVISNAIKELPGLSIKSIIDNWDELGVTQITYNELETLIRVCKGKK